MLRPFFSYYGSKWRDSPRLYPKPLYKTIIEPFAGSAGYSLRYPEHDVLLVDADPVIAGVWKYLIAADESEILGLPDVKEGQRVSDLDIPEQAKWLIGFWLNHGSAAPAQQPSAWMRKGTHDS
jgi:site-specific DNA-adenine methylase